MDNLNLQIKRLEWHEGNGGSVLAVYHLFFQGKSIQGDEPAIKGIRLFKSNRDGSYYIRMPQIQLKNGRSFNIVKLPDDIFRELEQEIIANYEDHLRTLPEVDEINIEDIPLA